MKLEIEVEDLERLRAIEKAQKVVDDETSALSEEVDRLTSVVKMLSSDEDRMYTGLEYANYFIKGLFNSIGVDSSNLYVRPDEFAKWDGMTNQEKMKMKFDVDVSVEIKKDLRRVFLEFCAFKENEDA